MTPASSSRLRVAGSQLGRSPDRHEPERVTRRLRHLGQVARISEIATVLWSRGFRRLEGRTGLRVRAAHHEAGTLLIVGIDASLTLVVSGVSFSELLEPLTAKLRRALLPSLEGLGEGAEKRRFDYLEPALELPGLIRELVAYLRPPPPPPTVDGQIPPHRSGVALTAAPPASGAAGLGIAQATHRGGR